MSPQGQRSPSIVPLARDQDGNPIELPDGAVGWRIRRQTGGRPRLLLDSKKQPMLFPLDYTIADVEDILSPGNYLLDVVDKAGEPLEVTIGISLGMPRNAESVEPDNENNAPAVVPTTLPSTTSDVRLVLEANVRATQMAFIHNQRTLELGLRMAETLRDSVQVLASAQADWIKSVSSARGFFRNTAQPLPPVEVKQLTVHTGGDEDQGDEDDEENDGDQVASDAAATSGHWSAPFVPIVQSVVQQVGPAMLAWATRQPTGGASSKGGGGDGGGRGSGKDDRPRWEARELYDLRYAQQKGAAHREKKEAEKLAEMHAPDEEAAQAAAAAEQAAAAAEHAEKVSGAIAATWSPVLGLDVVKLLQLLPNDTVTKIMQVQARLSPDEQADAMQILRRHDAEGLADVLGLFDAASLEESTDFLRRLVVDWRATKAVATKPPTNGGGAGGGGSTSP